MILGEAPFVFSITCRFGGIREIDLMPVSIACEGYFHEMRLYYAHREASLKEDARDGKGLCCLGDNAVEYMILCLRDRH